MDRYSEYKASSIQWLKELPSHWGEKRAKYLFQKENRPIRETDEVITCFRDGTVTLRRNRRISGFTESFKEIGYQGIRKGDLVIHQMDAFAGATGVSDSDGKATPVYSVCTPKSNDIQTIYYGKIVRLMGLNGYIQSLYRGIRERSSDFRFETFAKQTLPIPPLAEQEKIVKFLESKTSNIDAYVAERERELRLLNELKESEIANVITHGLNPNVKMKDSGIPWIGMIPEHWSLRRIKYILSELKEKSEAGLEMPLSLSREEGIIPFSEKKNRTMESASYIGGKIVHKGDIVFNRFRARLFAISDYDGIVSSDYAVYKCQDTASPKYIVRLFGTEMYREAFNRKASGIGDGFNRLYTNDLFSMYAIFPPIDEQRDIVAYIEDKCSKVNALITELETEIEYLKEYKQSLIADCVTGQINVQNEL